jgi:hypothetical protein
MAIELWDSRSLYELRQDMRLDPVPDYFQRTYFGTDFYSEDDSIRFAELPVAHRKLAPFVMPTSQGKPIFERSGESVKSFKPAYIKVKDAVRVTESRNVLPSEIWRTGGSGMPSLQERFDKRVAEVVAYHMRAIQMQKAWMAARAFIDGELTINYAADQGEEHPEVTIDFGRATALDVTLSGSFWSDPSYDIIGMLSTQSNLMYNTEYGGRPTQLLVGSSVAPYIQKNTAIKELLKSPAQSRGGEETSIKQGLFNVDQPMSYIGTIGGIGQSLEIWTYKDTVQAPTGSMVDILNPKDALLIAPGAGGVMAHGAIYDIEAFEAGNISADVFPKMIKTGDPGDLHVMHQSSPLPVNAYPNRVSKMRVLA